MSVLNNIELTVTKWTQSIQYSEGNKIVSVPMDRAELTTFLKNYEFVSWSKRKDRTVSVYKKIIS